jgi:hypothetical protein
MTTHLDSGVGGLFKMALTFISQNVDFFSSPTHPSHIFFFFFHHFIIIVCSSLAMVLSLFLLPSSMYNLGGKKVGEGGEIML